jgi:serine/threonine-protein kinase
METAGRPGGSTATDPALEPGTLVNGLYRLVRLVGVGGMGEVWEARHERTKGRVALKLLLPEMGRNEQVLLRFQREVEITSALNHPNIVRVIDADKLPSGRPYLVMEFLDGQDLSHVSRTGQPLGLAEAVDIIEQAAMGLQAAHGQSVIHRDLKPANIFLVPLAGTTRLLVKIVDFGISKALDAIGQLTQSRSVIGTPNYIAPEQATGGASTVDARADQFSLAAIAYELLTGRMAFAGDGLVNVIFKVVREMPPAFSTLGIKMPPPVEAAVMRGLAKSPADRFGSVLELSDELKRAAGLAPATARPPAASSTNKAISDVVVGASPQNHPSPVGGVRPGAPLPTTLRASAGQLAVVARLGLDAPTGMRGGAARASDVRARSPISRRQGRAMAFVIGGAGLATAILIGVTMRGPAESGRPVPLGKPAGATNSAIQPSIAAAAPITPPPPKAVAPTPLTPATALASTEVRQRARTPWVEHVTLPAINAPPSGGHRRAPENSSPQSSARTVVDSVPKATAKAKAEAKVQARCLVRLGTTPWSEIWIDGKNTKAYTPYLRPIACGEHLLTFKRPDLRLAKSFKITAVPGDTLVETFTLGPP